MATLHFLLVYFVLEESETCRHFQKNV